MLLVARDSLVVAGGPGGLQVFNSSDRLTPTLTRASGIRGISALDEMLDTIISRMGRVGN